VRLTSDIPLAFPSDSLHRITAIRINARRAVTVENLTAFHRMHDPESFFLYLAGYHNTAKQRLIRMIAGQNQADWYHFGDIDPDGFLIAEHLIRGTA